MTKLFVIVATVGRAELTRQTVALLASQTRPPDGVIVVGASPGDVAGIADALPGVEVALSERGLPRQRNRGLDLVAGRADLITFFDDDFVPATDYLAQVERLFAEHPDVVGITGELVADGIKGLGIPLDEALTLNREEAARQDPKLRRRLALYGCNMSIRMSAAAGLRFDEALPLYGWLEDIEFTVQLGRRGRHISTGLVTGVHMGAKGGRTSGRKLGYSQVANVIYIARKGNMQPGLGRRMLVNNLVSNALRSIYPERHVDRRGRLLGNLMAITDWLRGRVDPQRILKL